jgi:hypothetical protein
MSVTTGRTPVAAELAAPLAEMPVRALEAAHGVVASR